MAINFRGFKGIKQGSCTKIALKEGAKQPEDSTINACSSIATLSPHCFLKCNFMKNVWTG